jgi:hypothetical protein
MIVHNYFLAILELKFNITKLYIFVHNASLHTTNALPANGVVL